VAGPEQQPPGLKIEVLQVVDQEAVAASSGELVSKARLFQLPSKARESIPDLFFRENSRPPRLSTAKCIARLSSYSCVLNFSISAHIL
jgi:hypothetical protein